MRDHETWKEYQLILNGYSCPFEWQLPVIEVE